MRQASNEADDVRLAMVGMVEGNGHPYSWSAIVNGYDPDGIARCPYPVIVDYLEAQQIEDVSIPGMSVTHIWAEDRDEAEAVAEMANIANVVDAPADVIGEVDAIVIPTDDGENHVARVTPFIGSRLPIFVDKPLATTIEDLTQFIEWRNDGHSIASSSALRYAPFVDKIADEISTAGTLRWLTNCTHNTWERYGIHALEPVARLLGPGFRHVRCTTDSNTNVYTIGHASGPTVTIAVEDDLRGGFGRLTVYGTEGNHTAVFSDTYTTFRRQLLSIAEFARTETFEVDFEETVDLMACIIAGKQSRNQNNRVDLASVYELLPASQP